MTLNDINVEEALERVPQQLKKDRMVSQSLRAAIVVLMLRVKLRVDRRQLPKGRTCRPVGVETRQVQDIVIQAVVTEYQAEVLEDDQGQRDVAPFPEGVTRPLQYGPHLKAHGVYLSPYPRVADVSMRPGAEHRHAVRLQTGGLPAGRVVCRVGYPGAT